MATYTRKKADDILNTIGANGLTQQSLYDSNKLAVAKGIVGVAKKGLGDNLGNTIDNTGNLINSAVSVVKPILFGNEPDTPATPSTPNPVQTSQASSGFGSNASGVQDNTGNGANTPSSTPKIGITAPTNNNLTQQQIASRTGFQVESPSTPQLGTPIRGTGGQITSYSDPGYAKDISSNPQPTIGTTGVFTRPSFKNTSTFTDGQGGSATISSDRGFSPSQVDSLNKTLAFNAKQSTKDMFARDAADAEKMRNLGQGDKERQGYLNSLNNAFQRGDQKGIALFKDLLQHTDKTNLEKQQLGVTREVGLAGTEATLQNQASNAAFRSDKEAHDRINTSINVIKDLEKEGASPLQKLSSARQIAGGLTIHHLDAAYGNDPEYQKARMSGLQGISDYFTNNPDNAPPLEYLNEIFKNTN